MGDVLESNVGRNDGAVLGEEVGSTDGERVGERVGTNLTSIHQIDSPVLTITRK